MPRSHFASNNLQEGYDETLLAQIENLRKRVYLIRNMQIVGVLSLLMCVVSMFALFAAWIEFGKWSFASALILMILSLILSLHELTISAGALDLLLTDLEVMRNEERRMVAYMISGLVEHARKRREPITC